MSEQKMRGDRIGAAPTEAGVSADEARAALVSAYLDGELFGKDLERFEVLLTSDPQLAREVENLLAIQSRLIEMGADILSEPVPEAMLETFSKFSRS